MNKSVVLVMSIYVLVSFYATIRYNIFGNVLLKDFPLYITNKILIFSSIILLLILNINPKKYKNTILPHLINISFMIHILLSLLILNPYYFDSFFTEKGSFTLLAGLGLLSGFIAYGIYVKVNKVQKHKHILSQIFLFFVALHLFFLGYKNWITPQNWYGYLPPISLINFLLILLIFYFKNKRLLNK